LRDGEPDKYAARLAAACKDVGVDPDAREDFAVQHHGSFAHGDPFVDDPDPDLDVDLMVYLKANHVDLYGRLVARAGRETGGVFSRDGDLVSDDPTGDAVAEKVRDRCVAEGRPDTPVPER
jgi:hypothetical protein